VYAISYRLQRPANLFSAILNLATMERHLEEDVREDFSVILTATLTLLGLIIGFSFRWP
jgi:hypothetical protein